MLSYVEGAACFDRTRLLTALGYLRRARIKSFYIDPL